MEPGVSIITFGVADLERSHCFYKKSIGLLTTRSPENGINFFQTHGATFARYTYQNFADDIDLDWKEAHSKFSGITLAHNVRNRREIDEVLATAVAAIAQIVKPAADTFLGRLIGVIYRPRRITMGSCLGSI